MNTFPAGRAIGALLLLLLLAAPAFAQNSIVGTWRTIDDETGEPRSLVRITEQNGTVVGHIVRLLPEGRVCEDCAPQFDGRDLRGVQVISGLRRDGSEWSGGRITDPKNGRTYRLKARLDGPNRLRLRGFIGVSALGRTQTWERVQ